MSILRKPCDSSSYPCYRLLSLLHLPSFAAAAALVSITTGIIRSLSSGAGFGGGRLAEFRRSGGAAAASSQILPRGLEGKVLMVYQGPPGASSSSSSSSNASSEGGAESMERREGSEGGRSREDGIGGSSNGSNGNPHTRGPSIPPSALPCCGGGLEHSMNHARPGSRLCFGVTLSLFRRYRPAALGRGCVSRPLTPLCKGEPRLEACFRRSWTIVDRVVLSCPVMLCGFSALPYPRFNC